MYPNASSRELAELQVFAKAVTGYQEDGRGNEDRGGNYREDTGDYKRREGTALARNPGIPASVAPGTEYLQDPGGERKA